MNKEEVLERLARIDEKRTQLLEPLKEDLQSLVDELAGREFGSLEANQEVARELQQVLNRLYLRVACPKCGVPSTIACQDNGHSRNGVFQLKHRLDDGRQTIHVGLARWPENVQIVPPALDRRRA